MTLIANCTKLAVSHGSNVYITSRNLVVGCPGVLEKSVKILKVGQNWMSCFGARGKKVINFALGVGAEFFVPDTACEDRNWSVCRVMRARGADFRNGLVT